MKSPTPHAIIRFSFPAIIVALALTVLWSGLLDDIWSYHRVILVAGQQHLKLVAISGALSTIVGVALGIVLSRARLRFVAEAVMQLFNVLSTIPTLALMALSMTVAGVGERSAIFALTVHALLPIVRNTYQGLLSLPQPMLEAARGMGMAELQILRRVEVPNAMPVVLAGVRTAMVFNVGATAAAFLIGAGGLGDLIFSGIGLLDAPMMLAGAIPLGMLALIVDFLFGRLSVVAVPGVLAEKR